MRLPAVVLISLLLPSVSYSLPYHRATHYTHRVWTQAQGLPQDTVRAIAQTRDGYLWVGTDEGLAKFDGYQFVSFTRDETELASTGIAALCAASDGTLWIGTSRGLTSYQGGRFQSYSHVFGSERETLVSDVKEGPDGSVWIAAGLYVARLRDGKVTRYHAPSGGGLQGVRVVLPEKDGTVWAAGYGWIGQVQGDSVVIHPNSSPLRGNVATGLIRDRDGQLLLSGSEGLFSITGAHIVHHKKTSGLPDNFVRSIHRDRDGTLWVGTNGGLARQNSGSFEDLSDNKIDTHGWVWCLYEDRDGSLWIGANDGLHQVLSQQFSVFSRQDGFPNDQPVAVGEDGDGRLWVGFREGGVGYIQNDTFHLLKVAAGSVFSIRRTARGDILIGTRTGLYRATNQSVTRVFGEPDSQFRLNVFDAIEDQRGRLWLGTNRGALLLEPDKPARVMVPGGVLLNDAVVSLLAARDGSIWAGTYGSGLWRLKDGQKTLYTTANGLPGNIIRTLNETADGLVWAGTANGGVAVLRNGAFITIGTSEGLPSGTVGRVLNDSEGSIWFATAKGLARVPRQELEQFFQKQIPVLRPALYGLAEGLRSAQCAPGYPTGSGGILARDGRLWFPTASGLAVFDPAARPSRKAPPPVRILEVLVDGVPADLRQPLELPPDTQRVEFRYAAVELTSPVSLRYQFRLQPADAGWVQANSRRSAEYSRLPQGRYVFHVAATSGPDQAAGSEASLAFVRQPRFFEIRAVQIALLLAAILTGWLLYRARLHEVQRRFSLVLEERTRIARELHDTLAQGFVGVASQLDAVTMFLRDQPETAGKYLELARRMAHHSLTEARRSIFNLRADIRQTEDFTSALRHAVEFVSHGKEIDILYDGNLESVRIDPETEQEILRIAQEAVANAAKHSASDVIRIVVGRTGGEVTLKVEDEGPGFDPAGAFVSTGGRFGLLGMKERAERLGAKFALHSSPDHGTIVEVSVPVK